MTCVPVVSMLLPPVPDPSTIAAMTTATASNAQMNFLVTLRERCRRLATDRSRRPVVGRPFGGVVAGMSGTVRQAASVMSSSGIADV